MDGRKAFEEVDLCEGEDGECGSLVLHAVLFDKNGFSVVCFNETIYPAKPIQYFCPVNRGCLSFDN
jgi:hypothetical protein